jgi:hypothetical protein
MPRLLIFAPCEKVILDNQRSAHLIGLLQQWKSERMPGVPEEPIPENAAAPTPWAIFTLWYRTAEDGDTEFVQTCELITPSGRVAFSIDLKFTMTAISHTNTVNVVGLPVYPGEYQLRLYLSETGREKERGAPLSTFPLIVTAAP